MAESYEHIRRRYYWPAMYKDISNYINKCQTCLKVKYDRNPIKKQYEVTPTPDKPFEKIAIDVFIYNAQKFLTMIDLFSKRITDYPIKTHNAIEIQNKLQKYFSMFPLPKTIQMDNGKEFQNIGIKNLLTLFDITPYYTTPGHSQSQGTIERVHSTLIELLNAVQLNNKSNNIKKNMVLATIAYNNTIISNLKLTPMETTFGKNNINPQNVQTNILEEKTRQYHQDLELVHKLIKENIQKEKTQRTEKLNTSREPNIDLPTNIYVKSTQNKKHTPKYFPVEYDPQTRKAINPKTKSRREFKIHPNRIKRPRKIIRKTSFAGNNAPASSSIVNNPSTSLRSDGSD